MLSVFTFSCKYDFFFILILFLDIKGIKKKPFKRCRPWNYIVMSVHSICLIPEMIKVKLCDARRRRGVRVSRGQRQRLRRSSELAVLIVLTSSNIHGSDDLWLSLFFDIIYAWRTENKLEKVLNLYMWVSFFSFRWCWGKKMETDDLTEWLALRSNVRWMKGVKVQLKIFGV